MSQKFNREEIAETRRLIRWYDGIAQDYQTAANEANDLNDAIKVRELRRLEDENRKRAMELRTKLREAGLP